MVALLTRQGMVDVLRQVKPADDLLSSQVSDSAVSIMGRTSTRKALSGHGYALLRQMGVAPSDLGLGRRGRPPKRKRGAKKPERPL